MNAGKYLIGGFSMKGDALRGTKLFVGAMAVGSMVLLQGCLATRDWVKEQMDPLAGRVTESENQITSLNGRVGGIEGKLGQFQGRMDQFDGRLGQVDAKAEKALGAIANLRLEKKLVIDMKDGANFAFNSSSLPQQAQREIDGFLSDLKGDPAGMDSMVFLVAGHTDSMGNEEYNYELGKKRADAVSRYLITRKSVDPLRVVPVSYGESAPVAENSNSQGRAKNRRVEILVYREGITSAAASPAAPAEPRTSNRSGDSQQDRLSRR